MKAGFQRRGWFGEVGWLALLAGHFDLAQGRRANAPVPTRAFSWEPHPKLEVGLVVVGVVITIVIAIMGAATLPDFF